jgi:hypothetical protein
MEMPPLRTAIMVEPMNTAERLMLLTMFVAVLAPYAKAALPSLLPLVRGAYRRAGSLDPRWLSFAKGALLAAVLMLFVGRVEVPNVLEWLKPSPTVPTEPDKPAPVKVLRVTYVWEKDKGGVPPGVRAALDKLNRQGIVATEFEEDTKNGAVAVPAQYKLALAEAQKLGIPALVVEGEGNKVRTVKVTTEAEVLEAAK